MIKLIATAMFHWLIVSVVMFVTWFMYVTTA